MNMTAYQDDTMVYYCKRCKELGELGDKDTKNLSCAEGSKCSDVVFGTYKSLKNYYHING